MRLRFERYFSGQQQETYYNAKNTTAFPSYIRNVSIDNDKLLISSEVTLLYTNILIIADVAMGGTAFSTTTNIYMQVNARTAIFTTLHPPKDWAQLLGDIDSTLTRAHFEKCLRHINIFYQNNNFAIKNVMENQRFLTVY